MRTLTRSDFPDDVHYRLYRSARDEQPTVICVQWFDYGDYDEDRFLSEEAFTYEDDALIALETLAGGTIPLLREVAEEVDRRRPEIMKGRSDYPDNAVHYRLYLDKWDDPVVICVQDFDYWDYTAHRFLSDMAFDTEQEAQEALEEIQRIVAGRSLD